MKKTNSILFRFFTCSKSINLWIEGFVLCIFGGLLCFFISLFPYSVSAQTQESTSSVTENSFLTKTRNLDKEYYDLILGLETTKSADQVKTLTTLGLPDVIILPTSPFYFLKNLWEEVELFFTFSSEKKVELILEVAEERLAEAYIMIEYKDFEKAKNSLEAYNKQIEKAQEFLSDNNNLNHDEIIKLVRKLEANTVKQQLVVDFLAENTEKGSQIVIDMKNLAINGLENSIEILVEQNIATPSSELKSRIKEILTGSDYDKEIKNQLETKMNERLRKEILMKEK